MSSEKLIPKMVSQMMVSQMTSASSKLFDHYKALISLIKRIYVVFWHNLSLDPRHRTSPYDPPPENEVKMKTISILYYRTIRITFLFMHITAVLTIIHALRGLISSPTLIAGLICTLLSVVGIICGTHRYWTHKAFNATPSLEYFLVFCHYVSAQFSVYHWVRLHRVHHKYSDTPIDPHNANRGLFFSHMGWQMIRRTPECQKALQEIWVDDLKKNKLIQFESKYWPILLPVMSIITPSVIPWYFWNESIFIGFAVTLTRLVMTQHIAGTVNSLGHYEGMKPFDKSIRPTDNWLSWIATFGDEGWHNYHHVFPSDYKASEFWGYKSGMCTAFIELCAKLGLAYNLKTTSIDVAMKRRNRTGDLSCLTENFDYITAHSRKNS